MSRHTVRSVLWVSGSALLAFFSVAGYYRTIKKMLPEWNDWHAQLLDGGMLEPVQFRVLAPGLTELAIRLTGMEAWRIYVFERFILLFLVGLVFQRFSRRWLSELESVLALVCFFYLYQLSLYAHFQPSEELNLLFFLAGFIAIERGRFSWLVAIVALGAANKQTVAFLIPVYWTYHALQGRGLRRDVLLRTLALVASFVLVRQGIRWSIGDRPYSAALLHYGYNLKGLASVDLRHWYFLLPSLLPLVLVGASWRRQPLLVRAIAPTIPLFVAVHFVLAPVLEFRTHMPLAFVTLPALILFVRPYLDRDT